MRMLKISLLEIRKSKKKYSKVSVLLIILICLFSLISTYYVISTGLKSDYFIYEISGNVEVDDYRFLNLQDEYNSDLYVYQSDNGKFNAVLKGNDKSFAAADELKSIIKDDYESQLYSRYGLKAFPVFVDAEYLERSIGSQNFRVNLSRTQKFEEIAGGVNEEMKKVKQNPTVIAKESVEKTTLSVPGARMDLGYTTPENLNPPSILGKMILAFFFVIPSYFIVHVFSASLIEDKIVGRLDTLLSTPLRRIDLIFGKMAPYMIVSIILVVLTALILGKSPFSVVFILPIVLFTISLHSFLGLVSRSYREMTFLVTVSSFFITAYLFIPALFSGTIPVSKISPITNLLMFLEDGRIIIEDYLLSTTQFYLIFLVLTFLSVKALNPEIMHSTAGIERKIMVILEKTIKSLPHCLVASISSIPFVFIIEFMLISVIFMLPFTYSVIIFILCIAFVEELFKTLIVYSSYRNTGRLYSASVVTATGFFMGEKILTLIEISKEYSTLLLSQYLLFPLTLHITSLLVFSVLVKRNGYLFALTASTVSHFLYNYTLIMLLM